MNERTSAKLENGKKIARNGKTGNLVSDKSKTVSSCNSCGACRDLSSPRLSSQNASSVITQAKAAGKESCAVSFMQRNYGNNFTASVLSPTIQKKCSCGGGCASCKGEKEAESVSRSIMKMSKPSAISCQPSTNNNEQAQISEIMSNKGSGHSLDDNTRSFIEPRFGCDFSNVRLHTDSYAARKSNELNAEAFTIGKDIFFNAGRYNPSSSSGKQLLAHELTHVVQQGGATYCINRSEIDDRRKKIVGSALSLTGEHYLMGAGGQIPDKDDGVNNRNVVLVPTSHTAVVDVYYGKDKGTKTHACGGRYSKVTSLPEGDPSNSEHQKSPSKYKWKRTSDGAEVWGEACEGKRHFDCGGFVSYCYHQACPEVTYPGPASGLLGGAFGWTDVKKEEIKGGDIAYREGHAGLCINNAEVISALGKKWGVHKEKVDKYSKFGRLKCLIEQEKNETNENRIQKKDYAGEKYDPAFHMCKKIKLSFNGNGLLMTNGKSYNYPAVSGQPVSAGKFEYSQERQKIPNVGPIPEGTYWINPSETWKRDWWKSFMEESWGNYRITIHPFTTTETFGRGGFFLHGGTVAGSAGCIDLTSNMDSFIKDLKTELGAVSKCQIHLKVDYTTANKPQKTPILEKKAIQFRQSTPTFPVTGNATCYCDAGDRGVRGGTVACGGITCHKETGNFAAWPNLNDRCSNICSEGQRVPRARCETTLNVSYNGKSVQVKVRDCGPRSSGRVIDLSLSAVKILAPSIRTCRDWGERTVTIST